jgi:hypothetical protein
MRKLYLTVLVLMLATALADNLGELASEPPTDLEELVAAAQAEGLFWTTGARNLPSPKQSCAVIISETPISWDEAAYLCLGQVGKSAPWKGRARAYLRPHSRVDSDTPHTKVVGNILVVGDPDLVARIAKLKKPR